MCVCASRVFFRSLSTFENILLSSCLKAKSRNNQLKRSNTCCLHMHFVVTLTIWHKAKRTTVHKYKLFVEQRIYPVCRSRMQHSEEKNVENIITHVQADDAFFSFATVLYKILFENCCRSGRESFLGFFLCFFSRFMHAELIFFLCRLIMRKETTMPIAISERVLRCLSRFLSFSRSFNLRRSEWKKIFLRRLWYIGVPLLPFVEAINESWQDRMDWKMFTYSPANWHIFNIMYVEIHT